MKNRLKETKSQERLINLMLQAGVKWPEWASHAFYGYYSGGVVLSSCKPDRYSSFHGCFRVFAKARIELALSCETFPNWHQCVITREQYEARDGWITWHGGECPIDDATPYEIMKRTGEIIKGEGFASLHGNMWFHDRGDSNLDITAYRLSKEQDEVCESVAACIPDQPTIDQLIQQWKQKDCALGTEERKLEVQQSALDAAKREADEAKKAVDDALLAAGYFVGGTLVEAEQPVITDWRQLRVGDVVMYLDGAIEKAKGKEVIVVGFDETDKRLPVNCRLDSLEYPDDCWPSDWKFIRRP